MFLWEHRICTVSKSTLLVLNRTLLNSDIKCPSDSQLMVCVVINTGCTCMSGTEMLRNTRKREKSVAYWGVVCMPLSLDWLLVLTHQFSLPQIWHPVIEGHSAQDCACVEWILLWHCRQTHSGFHRHYTQTSAKFLILLQRLKISWMCFIILNDLYMAHHNSLGICRQLKIRHLYGTFNFLDPVYLYGDRKLVCLWFSFDFVEKPYEGKPYLR